MITNGIIHKHSLHKEQHGDSSHQYWPIFLNLRFEYPIKCLRHGLGFDIIWDRRQKRIDQVRCHSATLMACQMHKELFTFIARTSLVSALFLNNDHEIKHLNKRRFNNHANHAPPLCFLIVDINMNKFLRISTDCHSPFFSVTS